jgi:hypothetical protein
MSKTPEVDYEVVLSGDHPDLFVVVSAPENATNAELQRIAEEFVFRNTQIYSKKRVE